MFKGEPLEPSFHTNKEDYASTVNFSQPYLANTNIVLYTNIFILSFSGPDQHIQIVVEISMHKQIYQDIIIHNNKASHHSQINIVMQYSFTFRSQKTGKQEYAKRHNFFVQSLSCHINLRIKTVGSQNSSSIQILHHRQIIDKFKIKLKITSTISHL